MAYCINCGHKLIDGSKFCNNCGCQIPSGINGNSDRRRSTYEGVIHKCPNCGEVLDSFVAKCPSCGYELRGAKSSESVNSFALKLSQAETNEQKITLLRSFPIPNTKEDIFEFMILAVTNINQQSLGEEYKNISEAWLVKFEQSYQKASLLFKNDSDFLEIQKIYDQGHKIINDAKKNAKIKAILQSIARNIPVFLGIIILVFAIMVDKTEWSRYGVTQLLEIVGYTIFIASACTLKKRGASLIDFGMAAISGLLTLELSFLLQNGTLGLLCGGTILIIVVINFVASMVSKKK